MSLGVSLTSVVGTSFFDANITHNLGVMAEAAGLYKALWRPEEIGIENASQLIQILEIGIGKLKSHPELFTHLNPANGWGNYELLVTFCDKYIEACRQHPDAKVSADR